MKFDICCNLLRIGVYSRYRRQCWQMLIIPISNVVNDVRKTTLWCTLVVSDFIVSTQTSKQVDARNMYAAVSSP
jgi:hypothetical protein